MLELGQHPATIGPESWQHSELNGNSTIKLTKRQTPIRGVLTWQLNYGEVNGQRKRVLMEDKDAWVMVIDDWEKAQTEAQRWF